VKRPNIPAEIRSLPVQIVKFVNDSQPGWVAVEFKDAEGHLHTVIDKIPVFTTEDLWVDSTYPQPCSMPCEILGRCHDANGRDLSRMSIASPLDNKSTDGLSEFVVLSRQLSD